MHCHAVSVCLCACGGCAYLRQLAVALDLLGATAVARLRYSAGRMGAGLDDLPIVHSVSKHDKDVVSRGGDSEGQEGERGDERRSGTRTVSRRASCAMQATLL